MNCRACSRRCSADPSCGNPCCGNPSSADPSDPAACSLKRKSLRARSQIRSREPREQQTDDPFSCACFRFFSAHTSCPRTKHGSDCRTFSSSADPPTQSLSSQSQPLLRQPLLRQPELRQPPVASERKTPARAVNRAGVFCPISQNAGRRCRLRAVIRDRNRALSGSTAPFLRRRCAIRSKRGAPCFTANLKCRSRTQARRGVLCRAPCRF